MIIGKEVQHYESTEKYKLKTAIPSVELRTKLELSYIADGHKKWFDYSGDQFEIFL